MYSWVVRCPLRGRGFYRTNSNFNNFNYSVYFYLIGLSIKEISKSGITRKITKRFSWKKNYPNSKFGNRKVIDYRIVSRTSKTSYIKFGIKNFRLILKVVKFLWSKFSIFFSNFRSYIQGHIRYYCLLFYGIVDSQFISHSKVIIH